jgi:hypothetical protein
MCNMQRDLHFCPTQDCPWAFCISIPTCKHNPSYVGIAAKQDFKHTLDNFSRVVEMYNLKTRMN